jgi:outer membrane protein OmpA-like peptidoglycan-associated protein
VAVTRAARQADIKEPWSTGRVLGLVAAPLMLLTIAAATVWAVDHIEDELVDATRADLTAAGVDPSGLEIEFDYRDGRVTGALPEGMTAAEAKRLVDHPLLRRLEIVDADPTADRSGNEVVDESAGVVGAGRASTEVLAETVDVHPSDLELEIELLQDQLDSLADEIRETVVFEFESTRLNAEARATLAKVVDAMTRYPEPFVEVVGHTDTTGDAALNQALSEDRAAVVEAFLIESGVAADRLRSRGAGDTEPIDTNETPAGRAQNRRVALTALASF